MNRAQRLIKLAEGSSIMTDTALGLICPECKSTNCKKIDGGKCICQDCGCEFTPETEIAQQQ